MERKLIAEMETEANRHEGLAKALRHAVKLMRDNDAQETLPFSVPSPTKPKQNGETDNVSGAAQIVAKSFAGEFTPANVETLAKVKFPELPITREKISFSLWRMCRKKKLILVKKGSAHAAPVYRNL